MKKAAFVYDFDGTLARGNIQEHSFIPQLELEAGEFWGEVKELAEKHDADEILTYMWRMLERAREKGLQITREMLKEHGAKTPMFEGVDSSFPRMTEHGEDLGLDLEHHVVSSGIYEMIRGCSIFDAFRWVFVVSPAVRSGAMNQQFVETLADGTARIVKENDGLRRGSACHLA